MPQNGYVFKEEKPLEIRMGTFSMKKVKPKSTKLVVLKYIFNNEDTVVYLSWVKCPLILLSLFLREKKI